MYLKMCNSQCFGLEDSGEQYKHFTYRIITPTPLCETQDSLKELLLQFVFFLSLWKVLAQFKIYVFLPFETY